MKGRWPIAVALLVALQVAPAGAGDHMIERISVAHDGSDADSGSYSADISPNGRFVVFHSYAKNLVENHPGGLAARADIYLRNRDADRTIRITMPPGGEREGYSLHDPSVSANGRYVSFTAYEYFEGAGWFQAGIFVRDRKLGTTARVDRALGGGRPNGGSWRHQISADGRFVAFDSGASNLVRDDTNDAWDVFVYELATRRVERVSISSSGRQAEERQGSGSPTISASGRFVAFASFADNLIRRDRNDMPDVFVRDRESGITKRVSVSSEGRAGRGPSARPSISSDGRIVAFQSGSRLVSGDTNEVLDVYVHNRRTGRTTRVSVTASGKEGNYDSHEPDISPDGGYVAFWSFADNLVPGYTGAFMKDRRSGKLRLVARSSCADFANSHSSDPAVSRYGRFVAFDSEADNLAPDPDNGTDDSDVFVRDMSIHCG